VSADPAKRFVSLLKRLKSEFGELVLPAPGASGVPIAADAEPLVEELVFSFLLWESTTPLARAAHQRLRTELVDFNELRVCLASELAELVGPRDPRGDERAQRMRATLSDLYRREHSITLAPLATAGKREAKLYLESLEGIPPFVVARTLLIALGGHAVPADERMRDLLAGEEIVEPGATVDAVTSWLERQVRSADAGPTAMLLQAWSDSQPVKRSPRAALRAEGNSGSAGDERSDERGDGRGDGRGHARGDVRGRNQDDDSSELKPAGDDGGLAQGKSDTNPSPKNLNRSTESKKTDSRKPKVKKNGAKSAN